VNGRTVSKAAFDAICAQVAARGVPPGERAHSENSAYKECGSKTNPGVADRRRDAGQPARRQGE